MPGLHGRPRHRPTASSPTGSPCPPTTQALKEIADITGGHRVREQGRRVGARGVPAARLLHRHRARALRGHRLARRHRGRPAGRWPAWRPGGSGRGSHELPVADVALGRSCSCRSSPRGSWPGRRGRPPGGHRVVRRAGDERAALAPHPHAARRRRRHGAPGGGRGRGRDGAAVDGRDGAGEAQHGDDHARRVEVDARRPTSSPAASPRRWTPPERLVGRRALEAPPSGS